MMEKQRIREQWMREDATIKRGEEENKKREIRQKRKGSGGDRGGGGETMMEREEKRKKICGAMQHADHMMEIPFLLGT